MAVIKGTCQNGEGLRGVFPGTGRRKVGPAKGVGGMKEKELADERLDLVAIITDATRSLPVPFYNDAALEQLKRWASGASEAFAINTQRAWMTDWRIFSRYCYRLRLTALPATPTTVARFIRFRRKSGRRPATLRRYLASIAKVHIAAGCENPCRHPEVEQAIRAATRQLGRAQKQARGLVWSEISRYLSIPPQTLRDVRDRALVVVAYDTMCRSEELVALDVGSIDYIRGTAHIRRSKTDPEGEGAYCYLSPLARGLLHDWVRLAGIKEGALFRKVIGHHEVGERLRPAAVGEIFRRVGRHIRLPLKDVQRLTGHSARVGAAQDQLAANIDIASIMQSGRWKDPRMVARYGAQLTAERSGMARLAALQGRA